MKVVLMDRDGTILVDPLDRRVDSIEKIELFPDTIEALKYLADNDFSVIFITNQPCIAEGRITEEEFWDINNAVLERLAPSGIKVLKTYVNGEASGVVSEFRKPGPGMLLKAAKDFNLNLSELYMVGDRSTDVQAGIKAGTKTVLVRTTNINVDPPEATYRAPNLVEAVKYIINQ